MVNPVARVSLVDQPTISTNPARGATRGATPGPAHQASFSNRVSASWGYTPLPCEEEGDLANDRYCLTVPSTDHLWGCWLRRPYWTSPAVFFTHRLSTQRRVGCMVSFPREPVYLCELMYIIEREVLLVVHVLLDPFSRFGSRTVRPDRFLISFQSLSM